MSTPRRVLNQRVRISKTGRPYVNVTELVRSELERMKSGADVQNKAVSPEAETPNGNGKGVDKK